jgi:hypothetical protein
MLHDEETRMEIVRRRRTLTHQPRAAGLLSREITGEVRKRSGFFATL